MYVCVFVTSCFSLQWNYKRLNKKFFSVYIVSYVYFSICCFA